MESVSHWSELLQRSFSETLALLVNFLPSLLGAALLLLAGWLIARLLRALSARLVRTLVHGLRSLAQHAGMSRLDIPQGTPRIVGALVFWLVVVIFLTAAIQVLGLGVFSDWLSRLVSYLPTLVAGGLIALTGLLAGLLARNITAAAARSARLDHADIYGQIVWVAILITTLVIGLNQIGIDVDFFSTILAILVAALSGGIALAFALGARSVVSNLIAAHYLAQRYQPGDTLRIADYSGQVLELTRTSVILETDAGTVDLPAALFSQQAVIRINGKASDA